jgi:hypothetical protein
LTVVKDSLERVAFDGTRYGRTGTGPTSTNSGERGHRAMAESDQPSGDDDSGPVPFMQRVLDNPFLLLFLGVTLPAVLYIIWGVMEIANIPIAK